MHDLNRRREAVLATMTRWQDRPFAWGEVDCVKVAVAHLRGMGHHLALGLHKAGTYRTALGARRALAKAGHASIAAALDGVGLERIAPAAGLPGDIVVAPGSDGWESVGIVIGNGAVAGFHDDMPSAGLQMIRIADFGVLEAWRA